VRCRQCGSDNTGAYRYCGTCGVPLRMPSLLPPAPKDKPEYMAIAPVTIAPEFLRGLNEKGDKILAWAQSTSKEIRKGVNYSQPTTIPSSSLKRIHGFVAELRIRRQQLENLDAEIRATYKEIEPSSIEGFSVSRYAINLEMFKALGLRREFSKQLESILDYWEDLISESKRR
jgi:hypothetical protein